MNEKNTNPIIINVGGDEFKLDKTRVAHWERFVPYFEQDEFFKNYFYINQVTKAGDSLSKRIRFLSLYQTASKIIDKFPNENVVECGCWNGCSTYIIAKILEKNNFKNSFYVFDSFEGLSEPTPEDLQYHAVSNLSGIKPQKGMFKSNENAFRNFFSSFDFIDIKKGWIPDRFKEVEDYKFSFVNIDVDIYKPTLESLNFFFPRLVKGGCIHLDDYNFREWGGNITAVEEFKKENEFSFSYEVPLGGFFLIK